MKQYNELWNIKHNYVSIYHWKGSFDKFSKQVWRWQWDISDWLCVYTSDIAQINYRILLIKSKLYTLSQRYIDQVTLICTSEF